MGPDRFAVWLDQDQKQEQAPPSDQTSKDLQNADTGEPQGDVGPRAIQCANSNKYITSSWADTVHVPCSKTGVPFDSVSFETPSGVGQCFPLYPEQRSEQTTHKYEREGPCARGHERGRSFGPALALTSHDQVHDDANSNEHGHGYESAPSILIGASGNRVQVPASNGGCAHCGPSASASQSSSTPYRDWLDNRGDWANCTTNQSIGWSGVDEDDIVPKLFDLPMDEFLDWNSGLLSQDLDLVGNQFHQRRDDAEYLQQISQARTPQARTAQAKMPFMNSTSPPEDPRRPEQCYTSAANPLGIETLPIGQCDCNWKSYAKKDGNKKKSLNKHLRNDHNHAGYACPQEGCVFEYPTLRGLRQHMSRGHRTQPRSSKPPRNGKKGRHWSSQDKKLATSSSDQNHD